MSEHSTLLHSRRWWISWDDNISPTMWIQISWLLDSLQHFSFVSPFFRSQKYHSVAFSISILCAALIEYEKWKQNHEMSEIVPSTHLASSYPSLAFFSIYKSRSMKHAEVHICANMTFIHHIHVTWSVHREREEMEKKRAIHEKFTNIFPFSTDTRLLSLIFNAFCWASALLWCCDSLVLRNDTQKERKEHSTGKKGTKGERKEEKKKNSGENETIT